MDAGTNKQAGGSVAIYQTTCRLKQASLLCDTYHTYHHNKWSGEKERNGESVSQSVD